MRLDRGRHRPLDSGLCVLLLHQPSFRASRVEPARVVEVRPAPDALFAKRNCTVPAAVVWIIIWSMNVLGVFAPSVPSDIDVRFAAAANRTPVETSIASAVVLSPTKLTQPVLEGKLKSHL